MPQFNLDCSHPDNFGCARRCALYMIVTYNCMADAYFPSNRTFNPHCVACNMCWDKSRDQRHAAQQAPYALVWARGPSGALFVNHWLVSKGFGVGGFRAGLAMHGGRAHPGRQADRLVCPQGGKPPSNKGSQTRTRQLKFQLEANTRTVCEMLMWLPLSLPLLSCDRSYQNRCFQA